MILFCLNWFSLSFCNIPSCSSSFRPSLFSSPFTLASITSWKSVTTRFLPGSTSFGCTASSSSSSSPTFGYRPTSRASGSLPQGSDSGRTAQPASTSAWWPMGSTWRTGTHTAMLTAKWCWAKWKRFNSEAWAMRRRFSSHILTCHSWFCMLDRNKDAGFSLTVTVNVLSCYHPCSLDCVLLVVGIKAILLTVMRILWTHLVLSFSLIVYILFRLGSGKLVLPF